MIRPIGDKILVKPINKAEMKVGTIVVKTEEADLRIGFYEVVHGGDTKINTGAKIYAYKYALMKVKPGVEELYIIKDSEVVAVEE